MLVTNIDELTEAFLKYERSIIKYMNNDAIYEIRALFGIIIIPKNNPKYLNYICEIMRKNKFTQINKNKYNLDYGTFYQHNVTLKDRFIKLFVEGDYEIANDLRKSFALKTNEHIGLKYPLNNYFIWNIYDYESLSNRPYNVNSNISMINPIIFDDNNLFKKRMTKLIIDNIHNLVDHEIIDNTTMRIENTNIFDKIIAIRNFNFYKDETRLITIDDLIGKSIIKFNCEFSINKENDNLICDYKKLENVSEKYFSFEFDDRCHDKFGIVNNYIPYSFITKLSENEEKQHKLSYLYSINRELGKVPRYTSYCPKHYYSNYLGDYNNVFTLCMHHTFDEIMLNNDYFYSMYTKRKNLYKFYKRYYKHFNSETYYHNNFYHNFCYNNNKNCNDNNCNDSNYGDIVTIKGITYINTCKPINKIIVDQNYNEYIKHDKIIIDNFNMIKNIAFLDYLYNNILKPLVN